MTKLDEQVEAIRITEVKATSRSYGAWWLDVPLDTWRIRKLADVVWRPDEINAFDDIYYQARALKSRNYRRSLSKLDRQVDNAWRKSETKHPYMARGERAKRIAESLEMFPRQVLSIIDDVNQFLISKGREEAWAEWLGRKQYSKTAIREILAEALEKQAT
jgi:hypothetical protein